MLNLEYLRILALQWILVVVILLVVDAVDVLLDYFCCHRLVVVMLLAQNAASSTFSLPGVSSRWIGLLHVQERNNREAWTAKMMLLPGFAAKFAQSALEQQPKAATYRGLLRLPRGSAGDLHGICWFHVVPGWDLLAHSGSFPRRGGRHAWQLPVGLQSSQGGRNPPPRSHLGSPHPGLQPP